LLAMSGLQSFLRGILRFRSELRPAMLNQLNSLHETPKTPTAVMFSCVDSRVLPSHVLQADVGEMFIVRNAGNLVPPCGHETSHGCSTEAGVMELGCAISGVKNVVVCGHSDCKAMGLLYNLGAGKAPTDSPLAQWMERYATPSMVKCQELEANGSNKPLEFQAGKKVFEAYIDPDNELHVTDKLSQVNALQQLHNIASYPWMEKLIQSRSVHLHAMWLDIHKANLHVFSCEQKRFVLVDENSVERLLNERALMGVSSAVGGRNA